MPHNRSNPNRMLPRALVVPTLVKFLLPGLQKNRGIALKTISPRHFSVTFAPALSVLLAITAARLFLGVSMPNMTRDITAIANVHPLSGVLSNLGILLWCVAATVCGFA